MTDAGVTDKAASVATIALGVIGVGTLLVMPVLMGALERAHGSAAQAAMRFAAVQSWSISAGCLLSAAVARRSGLRPLALAAVVCLTLADVITPVISSAQGLLMMRVIAGLAGGIAISLATARLASLAKPERQFGLLVLAQLIFAMVGPLAISAILGLSGMSGVRAAFWYLAGCDLLVAIAVFWALPRAALGPAMQIKKANTPRRWAGVALSMFAILCLYCGIGAYWPYVEHLGEVAGLTGQEVGRFLGLAAIGGVLGSLTPGFLTSRLTRASAILIAVAALLSAVAVTEYFATPKMFFVGTLTFYFGWYAAAPSFLALLAAVDRDGRPMLASMALVGIGFGLGSTLGAMWGRLSERVELAMIAVAAAALLALAAIAVVTRESP